VYAVGLLLLETLTGRRDGPPAVDARLHEARGKLDAPLARVLERALQKDATQRYADAGSMLRAMEEADEASRRRVTPFPR
jgi:hypothetical protein